MSLGDENRAQQHESNTATAVPPGAAASPAAPPLRHLELVDQAVTHLAEHVEPGETDL
jgi:hypothetical protein